MKEVLPTDSTVAREIMNDIDYGIDVGSEKLILLAGDADTNGNKELIEKLNNRIQELEMVIKNSLEELDEDREYGFTIARRNLFRVLDEKK